MHCTYTWEGAYGPAHLSIPGSRVRPSLYEQLDDVQMFVDGCINERGHAPTVCPAPVIDRRPTIQEDCDNLWQRSTQSLVTAVRWLVRDVPRWP